MVTNEARAVLDFWFGPLDEHGLADADHRKQWWKKDPAFDKTIEDRFGELLDAIARDEHEDWLEDARGRLAYIIVLDQFSRNIHRGSAKMFAQDERSQRVTVEGMARGHDEALATHERVFFYMPLMHSETLAHQEQCIEAFEKLIADTPAPAKSAVEGNLGFAKQHRDIVARFDRFPHRNALVGRATTDEEAEFLKKPGSSF